MHTLSATAEPEKVHIVSNDEEQLAPEIKVYGPEHYPLVHYFFPGVYIRQFFMPKGHFVVGCCHRTEHANIVQRGRVRFAQHSENGTSEVTEISGPVTFGSKPGVSKVLLILEDCIWSTVHLNPENETDLLKLRASLIDESRSFTTQEIQNHIARLS